ncbi:hypothetical protein [Calothrix sp. UHCC 0171]|uniref:hypothetical protein n=1 Tax=Calothrix sp. UHCC 0171 TaxID=3110245 RepID=UPI002B20CB7D|nr:hypothetical protein [Calothrix sp. UHCC 0171]MEA5569937.1 hypothetical protein [Calothrix sp. UHCC 0171]
MTSDENNQLNIPANICVFSLIPFHEKSDTDVNPESFAASKFFNCVSEALPKEALRSLLLAERVLR